MFDPCQVQGLGEQSQHFLPQQLTMVALKLSVLQGLISQAEIFMSVESTLFLQT